MNRKKVILWKCKMFSSLSGVMESLPLASAREGPDLLISRLPRADGNTPWSTGAAQLAAGASATATSLPGTIFAKAAAGNL